MYGFDRSLRQTNDMLYSSSPRSPTIFIIRTNPKALIIIPVLFWNMYALLPLHTLSPVVHVATMFQSGILGIDPWSSEYDTLPKDLSFLDTKQDWVFDDICVIRPVSFNVNKLKFYKSQVF